MKRKEILEKIQKLRKITGNDELAFKDEDLEDDFDPDKHDERMNQIFQVSDLSFNKIRKRLTCIEIFKQTPNIFSFWWQ